MKDEWQGFFFIGLFIYSIFGIVLEVSNYPEKEMCSKEIGALAITIP